MSEVLNYGKEFLLAFVWSLAPAFITMAVWNTVIKEVCRGLKSINYGQALYMTLLLRLFLG